MRHLLWVSLISLALTGCVSLSHQDMPQVDVAGIEAMPSQGMELRLVVKLRILNPSDYSIEYNGLFVEMDVQGMSFAKGVSNQSGTVPRYGESVISVPVTISALAMVRQVMGLAGKERAVPLTYEVRGKVAGPVFNSQRFTSHGEFKLPTALDGKSKP
ncbi:MAG: LEA type 2 family protein [Pseudomonadota bacterium]|nr:LEA type 2 family protein [Pseudomonadota bacterium]